jgi:hypothetical protein
LNLDSKRYGYPVPSPETDYSKITAKEIMDKIHEFEKRNGNREDSEYRFLNLLANYPVSMVSRNMTDTLSLMVALFYEEKYLEDGEEKTSNSYEDLSIIFCRSKSTISIAVDEKKAQAKELIDSQQARKEAKEIAKQQLIAEEKEILRKTKDI